MESDLIFFLTQPTLKNPQLNVGLLKPFQGSLFQCVQWLQRFLHPIALDWINFLCVR